MHFPNPSRWLLAALLCCSGACAPATTPDPDGGEGEGEGEGEACDYPEFGELLDVGSIMPKVRWTDGILYDGSRVDFGFEAFHCDSAWDAYDSVTVIVVAEWCTNCAEYLAEIEKMKDALEEAGSYLVLLSVENDDQSLPTNEEAQALIESKSGNTMGLRVGDADADPAGLIHDSPIWQFLPSGWVVRKRDMQVIVNHTEWQTFVLPFARIARTLEEDWTDPNNPPFVANCTADEDEDSEPNDDPTAPAPLAPGTFEGGICTNEPDFFEVEIAGAWRFELAHDPNLGDLDLFVVEPGTNVPLVVDGAYIGSFTSNAVESFEYAGPATVMVSGYLAASAPYTLTLTEL